jgi:hypothetical protein
MLFAISWVPRANSSEDRDRRTLKLFSEWKPPAGFDFRGFYDYADGNGGLALVETASAETILEALSPWTTFFEFIARPIVPSDVSTPIFEKGIAWRDSVR